MLEKILISYSTEADMYFAKAKYTQIVSNNCFK